MIIVRTPYRLSLFGGGTDYPEFFRHNGGLCLVSTIDKYSYVTLRTLPPFFEHTSRIAWSRVELLKGGEEARHPGVRGVLRYLNVADWPLELHYDSDIPARAGMGSSSAFVVGMLNAWWGMTAEGECPPLTLAKTAIRIEQEVMGETVGVQDQIACAYGGVNLVEIDQGGDFWVSAASQRRLKKLERYLVLLFTGFTRHASQIAKKQVRHMRAKWSGMKEMMEQAREASEILAGRGTIHDLFPLLAEAWKFKKRLSPNIMTPELRRIEKKIAGTEAFAWKLVGAGAGGFFLVALAPDRRDIFNREFDGWVKFPVRFTHEGSRVIFRNGG